MVFGQDDRVAQFVGKGIGEDYSKYVAYGIEKDGELVGGIVYHNFNGNSISASIHGKGNWLTRDFLWCIFHYPFEQARVGRITAAVEQNNDLSHNLVKRLGFTHEATLQKAGKSGDLHIYRMFREDCKWLEVLHEYRKRTGGL
jgi:RimJ/RimL family protein N-acetyltransferase